jgi:tRNA(fMet)-specific endonuclease VapC
VARRLILDTGVLITVERSTPDLRSVIGDDDYVVIAAITVAELRAGIELADERNRTRRAEFVSHLLELIPVEFF